MIYAKWKYSDVRYPWQPIASTLMIQTAQCLWGKMMGCVCVWIHSQSQQCLKPWSDLERQRYQYELKHFSLMSSEIRCSELLYIHFKALLLLYEFYIMY